jgi:hypothetical protein
MEKHDNRITECPPPEVLGAWFDGELSKESPEAIHIQDCVHCTRQLQLFELFEKSLKNHFTRVDESALVSRITAGVHRKLAEAEKPQQSRHFMSLAFRLAAAVVICLSAAVFLIRDEPVKPAGETIQPVHGNNLLAKDFPYYTDSQSQLGSLVRNGNSIPLHHLVSVDFGNTSSPVFSGAIEMGNYTAAQKKPVAISDQVNQVWIVDNLKTTKNKLSNILQAEGVPQVCYRFAVSGETLVLNAKVSKMQLVKLVRSCNNLGFDLVSPTAPQPEQNNFKGNADAAVLYKAKFVVNK